MVLGLIDELHNLSYTIPHQPTTMVVDPDFYDHPSGPEELIERWRKRLILRSLQLSEFPPSTTRDLLTGGALATFAPRKTPQFFYLRFIEAYLAAFDPHASISAEHNKSIAAFHTIRGEKYISHPNKSSWIIPSLHLRLKQWHHDFIPTVWFYQIAVLDTEIPQADHTRSSTQLQLSHYNEWE